MPDRDRRRPEGNARSGSLSRAFGPWSSAVTFALVVFLASVVPIPGAGGEPPPGTETDWCGPIAEVGLTDPFHVVGYAVLTILASRATGQTLGGILVAAAVATAFGFGIELVQLAVPWREFAWRDVLVNAIGASLGAAIVWFGGVIRARQEP